MSISVAGGLSDTVTSASVRFMILFTDAAACESAVDSLESRRSIVTAGVGYSAFTSFVVAGPTVPEAERSEAWRAVSWLR